MFLRALRFGGVFFAVGVEYDFLIALRDSWLYQKVIKPIRYSGRPEPEAPDPMPSQPHPVILTPEPPAPLAVKPGDPPQRAAVIAQVQRAPIWYHTIDLPHGVATPGAFDHRPAVHLYGLPDSLAGKRCLDVATFDGFWAFQMEQRGGAVTAIDLPDMADWDLPPAHRHRYLAEGWSRPTVTGFTVAHELLGSQVQRREMSVYNLSPEALGLFDVVFSGDLLIHLRDPNRALQNIRAVTRDYAIIVETVAPYIDHMAGDVLVYRGGRRDCVWWSFKSSTLYRMLKDAGFSQVEPLSFFKLDHPDGRQGPWRVTFRATP